MFSFCVLAISVLCLLFKNTQLIGVAGVTVLSLIHPQLFAAIVLLACIGFYFI